jgi:hypothetical protein
MSPPRDFGDGKYHIVTNMGTAPLPAVSVQDIGNVAAAAFAAGPSVYGQNVYSVGGTTSCTFWILSAHPLKIHCCLMGADSMPVDGYAAAFAKVFGKEFVHDQMTTEQVLSGVFCGYGIADRLLLTFRTMTVCCSWIPGR